MPRLWASGARYPSFHGKVELTNKYIDSGLDRYAPKDYGVGSKNRECIRIQSSISTCHQIEYTQMHTPCRHTAQDTATGTSLFHWACACVHCSCWTGKHPRTNHVHVNEACLMWMRLITHECVMSHHQCEWVMSHVNKAGHMWMSRVTCEWDISHTNAACHNLRSYVTWMRHVTSEWGMSHVKSHVTCKWVMWMWHETYSEIPYLRL